MTISPYELLARFNRDGTIAGVSVRTLTTFDDGTERENNPTPLAGASDPAFVAFASQFSAAVVAERDAIAEDKTNLTAELDAATAERDNALAEVARLTAELEAIRNPTDTQGFPILTPSQLRRGLRRAGVSSAQVAAVIAAIPDQTTREDAADLWEYSIAFHRDNSLVSQLGTALGMTVEQIDTLWRAAGEL
jgi:hypothetical protein